MSGREYSVALFKVAGANPTIFSTVELTADGALPTSEKSVPARTPLTASLVVGDALVQLSGATPDGGETSTVAWLVIVPSGGAGVRVGGSGVTAGAGGFEVEAGSDRAIPSSSLSGWYAISTTGESVTITLSGAA